MLLTRALSNPSERDVEDAVPYGGRRAEGVAPYNGRPMAAPTNHPGATRHPSKEGNFPNS